MAPGCQGRPPTGSLVPSLPGGHCQSDSAAIVTRRSGFRKPSRARPTESLVKLTLLCFGFYFSNFGRSAWPETASESLTRKEARPKQMGSAFSFLPPSTSHAKQSAPETKPTDFVLFGLVSIFRFLLTKNLIFSDFFLKKKSDFCLTSKKIS